MRSLWNRMCWRVMTPWQRIETILSAYDEADRPGPETFSLHIDDGGQHLQHRGCPAGHFPQPLPASSPSTTRDL